MPRSIPLTAPGVRYVRDKISGAKTLAARARRNYGGYDRELNDLLSEIEGALGDALEEIRGG